MIIIRITVRYIELFAIYVPAAEVFHVFFTMDINWSVTCHPPIRPSLYLRQATGMAKKKGAFTRSFPLWPRVTWKLWCLWTLTNVPTLSKPSIVLLPFWTCCSCWTMLLLHSVGAFLFSPWVLVRAPQNRTNLSRNSCGTLLLLHPSASYVLHGHLNSQVFHGNSYTPLLLQCNVMSCMYVICVSMYL